MVLEERGRGARGRARLAASLLMLVVLVVVAGCGGGSKKAATTSSAGTPTTGATATTSTTSTTMPATAPAFTADQLAATAGVDWLTNGSSLTNDRFSSLTQINDGNVQGLRGNWMTHLRGSGTALKYSAEGTALEYQGVLYETTGADDVFAVDVDSGQIKWQYKPNLPASLASVVCCGWDNRGASLGDGKIFLGQLDGKLVALDQATGRPVWTTAVASPKQAYTITMPPLYYDGKVYVGPVGADYGGRGFLDAYDATTGKRLWRFYNVPGPGQAGHETWPKSNDAWKRGGATVWSSPSVDPQLGLLYYSTGNAGNDWDGRNRPGDNLYSSSIVALDTKTGKVRWHYQQVHHDVWDFDSPSPTVLIDTTVNGTTVHGIAQPSKTGYVYFLDRATGKPVFPINETPVPQYGPQRTAKTQPIPTMPPFSATTVSAQMLKTVKAAVAAQVPRGQKPPTITAGRLYGGWATIGSNTTIATAPSAAGGNNWQPSSYNPQRKLYYVCSQSGAAAYTTTPSAAKFVEGRTFAGVAIAGISGFNSPGALTAYDMTTGKIAWQKKFPDSCYSGAVSTAGNLVFVGRNRGQFEAYNGTTGELLWSFQTGAGVNAPATVFERNGRQHVAVLAGGNALAGTPHGDNLWDFSLEGTLGPAQAPGSGSAIQHAGESRRTRTTGGSRSTATSTAGDVTAGRSVFADNCSVCHGDRGTGGNGGPNLTTIPQARTIAGVVRQVTNGGGGMPAFGGQLSDKQIADVAAFVTRTITGGR